MHYNISQTSHHKYVIQNMPLSPHTHTPNHASLLTPPGSAARIPHTIYHCISGLSQTILAPQYTRNISQASQHQIHHPTHTHHHHTLDHTHSRITFDPPGSARVMPQYTIASAHCHRHISAPNAFAISHKYLTTKYVTQHTHPSPSHT